MTPQTWADTPYCAGPKSKALFQEEQKFIAPGLQTIALYAQIAIEGGNGAVLRDVDGKTYLDLVAGIGVASLGYGHPEWTKAIGEQAAKTAVGSFTSPHRLNFLKTLACVTPKDLTRCQLYSSGAEAVEAALRLAKSKTGRFEVLGFWGGFHGKTMGVMGLLNDGFKNSYGPMAAGLHLAPYPDSRKCPFGTKEAHDCGAHCLEFLREMIKRETTGAIAAIIIEPIQGTNGNVAPPAGFFNGVRELAREIGAVFISDEMITGFGRTGRMFGCDHEGVVPDMMTIGKGFGGGFPVSGVVTTTEIASAKPWANPSGSSSSYGGNPLASAACDITLQMILRDNLAGNSAKVGAAMLERLREMQARQPLIGAVRGRGLMIGVDLVNPKTGQPLDKTICREVFEEGLKRGVLTMAYNPSLRINPPLVISKTQALEGLALLDESLDAVSRRRGL
ncbi:MAG TPA: aspartate aminotransferase family protein [Elusimicrobia bacterium]|nr:aspartate aminotransferase family protein [Elusimicrobiota bacterium]